MHGPSEKLMASTAWENLAATLADTLSQFFQTAVSSVTLPDRMPDPAHASSITMSDVAHQIEMGVGMIADEASARKIAEDLFGDASLAEDEEMIADIIAELANLAMGGLKTSFSEEGFVFAGGIPKPHNLHGLQQFLAPYSSQRAASFSADNLGLIILVGLKRKHPIDVPADRLSEGMVLAEDFRAENGLTLLRSGTLLTASYAQRLGRCAGDRTIKVCDPSIA